MHVQHHRVISYTLAGAVSGAATTGLGAVLLHPAAPDAFQREGATVAGLVGGAVTHAALGAMAAFSGDKSRRQEIAHVASSTILAGLTSGLAGGAILGAAGYHNHPTPGHMVLSGVVGGLTLAVATGIVTGTLFCCRWGCWAAEKVAEGGEHLLHHAEGTQDLESGER